MLLRATSSRLAIVTALLVAPACGMEVHHQEFAAAGAATLDDGNEAPDGLPTILLAASRTSNANEVRFEGPYRIIVELVRPTAESGGLTVRAVRVTRAGELLYAHAEHLPSEPLPSGPDKSRYRVAIPLDKALVWHDGDTIDVTLDAQVPGGDQWVSLKRSFQAKRRDESYSACERLSMP